MRVSVGDVGHETDEALTIKRPFERLETIRQAARGKLSFSGAISIDDEQWAFCALARKGKLFAVRREGRIVDIRAQIPSQLPGVTSQQWRLINRSHRFVALRHDVVDIITVRRNSQSKELTPAGRNDLPVAGSRKLYDPEAA